MKPAHPQPQPQPCRRPEVEPRQPAPIRVNLTRPVTREGFGPFSFDPVEQLLGGPFCQMRASVLAGPASTGRRSPARPATLRVPWDMGTWPWSRLSDALERGPEALLGQGGTA